MILTNKNKKIKKQRKMDILWFRNYFQFPPLPSISHPHATKINKNPFNHHLH